MFAESSELRNSFRRGNFQGLQSQMSIVSFPCLRTRLWIGNAFSIMAFWGTKYVPKIDCVCIFIYIYRMYIFFVFDLYFVYVFIFTQNERFSAKVFWSTNWCLILMFGSLLLHESDQKILNCWRGKFMRSDDKSQLVRLLQKRDPETLDGTLWFGS